MASPEVTGSGRVGKVTIYSIFFESDFERLECPKGQLNSITQQNVKCEHSSGTHMTEDLKPSI